MNLLQKLHAIQTKVRAVSKDETTKSQYNPNGFNYVSGDKIIGVIRPLMDEMGVILKSEVIDMHNSTQQYTTSKGATKNEVLTNLRMRMTWIDTESGEREECMWGANGMNDWDKGFGSAVTYGIRYFILKSFLVSTDADDVDGIIRDVDTRPSDQHKSAPQPEPMVERPWLEDDADALTKVRAFMKNGGSIDDVYTKFRMKNATKQELINLNK
jgi:hypothetical protein